MADGEGDKIMVEQGFTTRADKLEASGTPLRKFKGKLIGSDESSNKIFPIQRETREGQSGPPGYVVVLNFEDLDVLESVTPWNYPVAQLTINYRLGRGGTAPSDRGGWGILLKSADDVGFPDLQDLVGKVVTMEAEPEHDYGTNRETGEAITAIVWRVVEVEGGGAEQMTKEDEHSHILKMIDGKDRAGFSEAMLQDEVGRRFSNEVFDGTLIASLLASGEVEQEGEVYRVKGLT